MSRPPRLATGLQQPPAQGQAILIEQELAGLREDEVFLMLVGGGLRIVHATLHERLADAPLQLGQRLDLDLAGTEQARDQRHDAGLEGAARGDDGTVAGTRPQHRPQHLAGAHLKALAGEIEIAPLAFMRGRTLANAFAILDEAQNLPPEFFRDFPAFLNFAFDSRDLITVWFVGHPLLAQVTATGCLLGAILAACLAVESDPLAAALAGVSILNIAAELAAGKAQGPGTFAPHLLDALAALTADDIATRLNLEFS